MTRAGLVACACALASCSFTFDDSPADFPLVGAMPDTDALPHLNHGPAGTARIMYGVRYSPWAVFNEAMPGDFGDQKGLRLVHLEAPFEDLVFDHQDYFSTWSTFYVVDRDPATAAYQTTRLSLFTPGESGPDAEFTFPGGAYVAVPDELDTRFLYFVQSSTSRYYYLQLRDGSFQRTLPIPDGVDPADPLGAGTYRFSYDGSLLFVRDGKDVLTVYSTTDLRQWSLGPRPALWTYDDGHGVIYTCGADGVHKVVIGGADVVLDSAPCDDGGSLDFHDKGLLYQQNGVVMFLPALDGSATAAPILDASKRLLGFTSDDQALYSTEPDSMFVNGASDGWLGGWQFMQRGLALSFSNDNSKLRWLEDAANPGGIGDLTVAAIPGGAPSRLARNVRQYDELRDGRILAATNHAFRGTQNRVVLIDEHARTQTWVASAASEYVAIPYSDDILIDVVTGPSTFDIVRVANPANLAPQ